jgi:hypothetical protein
MSTKAKKRADRPSHGTRVRRRGFSADVRRGSTVRLVDEEAMKRIRFVPDRDQGMPMTRWKLYTVTRRNARYLWLHEHVS